MARVGRMLDACAGLVDEVGYDGLTTPLLAERAGVAIGSVYQFFPDKRALVQALTMRHLETYLARVTARLDGAPLSHWWEAVDAAIDEYIEMHRSTPGFRSLHFGDVVDVHLLDAEQNNNTVIADRLRDVLVDRFEIHTTPRLDFAMAIAVEAGDALIKLAFRRDPDGAPAVPTEAKSLLRDYLTRYVNEPASRSV